MLIEMLVAWPQAFNCAADTVGVALCFPWCCWHCRIRSLPSCRHFCDLLMLGPTFHPRYAPKEALWTAACRSYAPAHVDRNARCLAPSFRSRSLLFLVYVVVMLAPYSHYATRSDWPYTHAMLGYAHAQESQLSLLYIHIDIIEKIWYTFTWTINVTSNVK